MACRSGLDATILAIAAIPRWRFIDAGPDTDMTYDTKEARSFRADHVKRWLEHVGLEPHEVEDRALAALFVAADEKWCDLQAAMVEPGNEQIL